MARWRGGGFLPAMVALLLAPGAAAQTPGILGLAPGRGELGFDFTGTWRGYTAGFRSLDGTSRQWLRLPLSGALIDQRILAYDLSLNPVFGQLVNTRWGSPVATVQFGYDLGARLLPGRRASATVMSGRRFGSGGNAVAGRSSFETSQFAATLYLRTAFIPISLGYSQRSSVDEWVVPGLPAPLGRSDAGHGWKVLAQGRKTRLTVERTFYNDRTNGGDFSLLSAGLDHSLRWGKGSSLGSSMDTEQRQNVDSYTRRRLSESLHLQHTRNLSSDYSFMLQSRWPPGGAGVRSRSIGTGVSYRPRSWLGLAGAASTQSAQWASGRTAFLTLTPRLDLRAALPLGAAFSGDAGMGYERRTEEAVGDGFAPVADEPHSVGATRSFFLEHFDVDPNSVVVRRTDQTLVYQPGIDYRLVPAGLRLQVDVLPGGRIAEGETVLVSYRYRVQPSSDVRALITTYRATITIAGLQLTHHGSLRSLLGAEDTSSLAAGELQESFTQVGGGRRTPVGQLHLSASYRRLRSHSAAYTTYELGGTLAPPPMARLQSNIGGSVARAATDGRSRNTWALRSSAAWTAGRGLRLEGGLEASTWQPDQGPAERYISANVGLNSTFGAWEAALGYQYQRRVATVAGTDNRLSARMVRRL